MHVKTDHDQGGFKTRTRGVTTSPSSLVDSVELHGTHLSQVVASKTHRKMLEM